MDVVEETERVLASQHTRPSWSVHIVVILKLHIESLLTLSPQHSDLLLELMDVVKRVASGVVDDHGCARVITNLGNYQDSKHLHWHVVSGNQLDRWGIYGGSIPAAKSLSGPR